jgi:hypothetical protein
MRSGSSLLLHLLVSNGSILGFGENHLHLWNDVDIDVLTGKVLYTLRSQSKNSGERYVIDKVLHGNYINLENQRISKNNDIFSIFLVREPVGSINSMIKWLGLTEEQAVDYYLDRLNSIRIHNKLVSTYKSCVLLTYDQLLHQTTKTFRLLETFLSLDEALSETYQLLPSTGKAGIGDSSPYILTGQIQRPTYSNNESTLDKDVLTEVKETYETALRSMESVSLTIVR